MKLSRLLGAIALALPATMVAQQPAAPAAPPANPITLALKNSGTRNANLLMQAFDSIPESKYGFKPTEKQLTIGYIAQHLENANYFLCNRFGPMKYTFTARDSMADTVKAKWPKDTLTARLKASFAFCDAAFAQLDDAKLAEQITVAPNRNAARAGSVLGYVTDLVDHYSQMANYMRAMGMLPPSALPRPGRGGTP
jgi:uncharacterized damage-inducible protein DinB